MSWPPDDDLPYGVDGEWADGTVPADRTRARAARMRAAGARMCGPVPPTDEGLDIVEAFAESLRRGKVLDVDVAERVRAVADPLIEHGGYSPGMIYTAVFQALGIGIGKGGGGTNPAVTYPGPLGETASCPYCGATGGGGHGGFCPNAAR